MKALAYQPTGLTDQGSVHAVHLVVEAARVAQVVAGAVATPEGRRYGAAVDALPALAVVLHVLNCSNHNI